MKCRVDQICTSFHCGLSRRDRCSGRLVRWVHRLQQCQNPWSAPVPLFLSRAHHVRKHQANMLLHSTLEPSRTRPREPWFLHVTVHHQSSSPNVGAIAFFCVLANLDLTECDETNKWVPMFCRRKDHVTQKKECLRVCRKNVYEMIEIEGVAVFKQWLDDLVCTLA